MGVAVAKLLKYVGLGIRFAIDAVLYLPIKGFNVFFGAITRTYPLALDKALAWPVSTLAVTVTLLAGSLLLFGQLGRELVPELVQGQFYANLELPPGTSLDVSYRRISKIEDFARSLDGVETVYAVAGTSNDQGGIAGELRENIGQVTMTLARPIDREKEDALMERLRPELERDGDMKYRFGRPSYFSFKTPIEVEIRGFNLKLLRRMADDLVARMHEIPGLADIKSSTEGGYPELQIRFNRERLASLGFNINDAAALIRSKVLGTVATDITREDRTIDIRLRSEEKYRNSTKDLGNLSISESGTTPILLSSVAEVIETEGPAEIRRADGERVALITANLVERDLGSVSEDIEAALRAMTWPVGFDYRLGGQRKEMETSFQSMQFAILLAIFMVYLVMASQFESLLHPLVILFSVPFSLVGVMVILWALSVTVSVVVLIGVIMLAGIVVNNAIILVDYTNRLRREGTSKLDALRQAGQVRLRPILMTTSTTVLGLFPMALGLGEGSELRSPMAWTVIGGLVVSTGLTLLIIPVVYSLLDRSR